MQRLLTALVVMLPLCLTACTSYAIHLYSDPTQLQVIDESLVLTEAESDGQTIGVLMRGDSVVVIGERRGNWEYEQDLHDRDFIVYFGRRRAYVPYRSLVSRAQYASLYGPGATPPEGTPTGTPGDVGPGAPPAARDTNATRINDADLTGGPTGRDARRR